MNVELLVPERRVVPLADLSSHIAREAACIPFDPAMLDAVADLSQRIFRDPAARRYPELIALAYSMRKTELARLHEQFDALARKDRILAPRGLVFHVPPRNVDTMFVYSWLLAALTGNRNVIRLSPQRSDSSETLLGVFREALAAAPEPVNGSTVVLSYGHEEEPTALLSSICDLRVVWGGDAAVAAIRRASLAPHARELTFPDRYSMAAISSAAWLALDGSGKRGLAERFFNDSFWFDQLACSSPRLVVWCGERAQSEIASRELFDLISAYASSRGYTLPPAVAMRKLVFACSEIADKPVSAYRRSEDVTVLTLDSLNDFDREHPGGGLFMEAYIRSLGEIDAILQRRDQTLTYFGFEPHELHALARRLNGRAIDRIVPIGQALEFQRFWDGYDLMHEFCRHVYVGA